jgi:integrase
MLYRWPPVGWLKWTMYQPPISQPPSKSANAWALPALTPHEARHTAAGYMAAAGLTPKEAQTAMGHADFRTTLNVYVKAVPGWQQQAAAKLDAYLDRSIAASALR